MSGMKERGPRALKSHSGEHVLQRKRRAALETDEAFVDAFVDALRDILQSERPRAA
jgi:hypothetical protein